MTTAAILVQQVRDVSGERQLALALSYVTEVGYRLTAIVRGCVPGAAGHAVKAGIANVIVVAFGGEDVSDEVAAAGGRIEAVHPTPHVVPARTGAAPYIDVMLRWYCKGRGVIEIADLLDSPTVDIDVLLRAAGIAQPRR